MNIYIPTYGRPERQITFKCLSKGMQTKVVFICVPSEEKQLRQLWQDTGCNFLVCDKKGVSAARQAALEHSVSNKVCFFDDDLRFSKRLEDWDFDTNGKLAKATKEQLTFGIIWMQNSLNSYPIAALGARGGNQGIRHRWVNPNYRVMRSFAVDKSVMQRHDIRFDDFYYWEDFHVALSLLELGYENVVNVDLVSDGVSNTTGGVQRNLEQMMVEANRFAELHPTAKLRMKTFFEGKGKIEVPDFTIQWKKTLGIKT